MVQAELEKTSLTPQLSDTIAVVDSVIAELRSSQNGNAEGNTAADQLISSLTEIRGNTVRQNPVIVWQNPQILLNGKSVTKGPEQTPAQTETPTVRKKTKIQQYYERRGKIISTPELSNIIGVSTNIIRSEASSLKIELFVEQFKFGKKGTTHLSLEDAKKIADSLLKKKLESQFFGDIEDEFISIQAMAGIVNSDAGSVAEIAGRLEIPVEVRGNQRLISRNFAEKIKVSAEQRSALERLMRYSQQQDEEPAEEVEGNGNQIVQKEGEDLDGYISAEQFYKTIGIAQTHWSTNKSRYPQVRIIRRGRFKFFSTEDAEKIKQIREHEKAEKGSQKEEPKKVALLSEGYISYEDFLNTLGISKQRWHQIKESLPPPTRVRVGKTFYYLKTDVDAIKEQRRNTAVKPRTFTRDPRATSPKPGKIEQQKLEPATISEFAAQYNLTPGRVIDIANGHFNWDFSNSIQQLSERQQNLVLFYLQLNLKEPGLKPKESKTYIAPEGCISRATLLKNLGIKDSQFQKYALNRLVTAVKVGNQNYYTEEQVEILSQRWKEIEEERLERRQKKIGGSQIDRGFAEMMDGSTGQNSNDLDLYALHLKEIAKIPMELKKHKLWSIRISAGQVAAHILSEILNHKKLVPGQKKQIITALEEKKVKVTLSVFHATLDSLARKVDQKTIEGIFRKIDEKQKLTDINIDKDDENNKGVNELSLHTYQSKTNSVIDEIERIDRIINPELAQNELQKLIDTNIRRVNIGIEARDRLITASLRLVISVAKKYSGKGFALSDLEQYGDEGLIKAVDKFNWRLGYKFSTYAVWWIRQSVARSVADYSSAIRLPIHVHERLSKVTKEHAKATQRLGKEISIEDFIDSLNMSLEAKTDLKQAIREKQMISINSPVGDEEGSELGDLLEDENVSVAEQVDMLALRNDIEEVLDTLTYRESRVLKLRFGLEDGKSRTLEETAKEFQLSRERIRQIEAKALRKLRHPSRSRKLRPYKRQAGSPE